MAVDIDIAVYDGRFDEGGKEIFRFPSYLADFEGWGGVFGAPDALIDDIERYAYENGLEWSYASVVSSGHERTSDVDGDFGKLRKDPYWGNYLYNGNRYSMSSVNHGFWDAGAGEWID